MYSIFIPHAGEIYAGNARKKAFNAVKNLFDVKYIIFIAALHDSYRLSENKLYILYKDKEFPIITSELTKSTFHEHSYEWIKEEIIKNFPLSQKLVICPTKDSERWIAFSEKLIEFIKNMRDVLLIGTSDLLHYGKKFGNEDILKYPRQQSKVDAEESLIKNIVENRCSEINDDVLCGFYATQMFCYINKKIGIGKGCIVDYYDSSVYNSKEIDKYVIDPIANNPNEFVSYVSIVYGDAPPRSAPNLKSIDNSLALGYVKSVLLRSLYNKKYELRLPTWSSFSNMKNGIFVSTFLNEKINSCYGSFESNKHSSAYNIIKAASMCVSDSVERWKNPINLNNINSIKIEIDILDERRTWKKLSNFEKEFIMDGKSGVYLILGDGSSATYLPSVAREYKKEWSILDYIENLSQKAGGKKSDWKLNNTKIYTYKISTIQTP